MRIVALDAIRFGAALSVVLYHYISRPGSDAFPVLSGVTKYGYLGVPLFFIISGYVIALSAHNRTAVQFAVSRFVRLYPTLWVCVIITALTMGALTNKQYSVPQVLSNFTLVNEYLGFEDVDGVYWTLKQELKFYGCVCVLLAFGVFEKYRVWISIWLASATVHIASGQPFFMGWFISPQYSPFFIGGVAFYLIHTNGENLFNRFVVAASLVLASYRSYEQANGFMSNPDTMDKCVAVAIVWLFFIAMYLLSREVIVLREKQIYVTLGAVTYPLYLVHNLVGKAIIDKYSVYVGEGFMIPAVIIVVLVMSWAIHVSIEKPFAEPMKRILFTLINRLRLFSEKAATPN